MRESTIAGLYLLRDADHPSIDKIIRALLRARAEERDRMNLDDALEAYASGEMTAEELEAAFPGVFDLEDELDREEVD